MAGMYICSIPAFHLPLGAVAWFRTNPEGTDRADAEGAFCYAHLEAAWILDFANDWCSALQAADG